MNINVIFDASANNAPAAFKTALAVAVTYLDNLITNPITVNIQVGYGEDNGQPLGSDLGEGGPYAVDLPYSHVVSALAANANTAAARLAVANLPATDPGPNSDIAVGLAEEKAWGLIPANGTEIDGTVGFSSTAAYDYNPNDRAISGQFDFIGVAEHELTHALGRMSGLQFSPVTDTVLDLFRYRAPGLLQTGSGIPAYFSIDGGVTNLNNFDTTSDFADWTSAATADAFDETVVAGVENVVSPVDITELNVIGFDVTPAPPGSPVIAGTEAGQVTTDQAAIDPFTGVSITDPNAGQTDTVTVTVSDAANGMLSNLDGGTYNASTGVYIDSGAAAAVTAALDGLVFTPTQGQGPVGQTVTTGFAIDVTDTAGASAADTTTTVVTTETIPPQLVAAVSAAYQAILRVAPAQVYASQIATAISDGGSTLGQFEATLLTGEQVVWSTLPALVTIDATYNVSPSSSTLTSVTSYAAYLHDLGYSDANVWSILGGQFALNGAFGNEYGSMSTTAFVQAVYQREFGFAPSANTVNVLVGDMTGSNGQPSGLQSLLDPTEALAPSDSLLVKGGMYGYLLWVGQTAGIGEYTTAATEFLQAAANGTVVYGEELTQEFPPGTGGIVQADAAVQTTGANQAAAIPQTSVAPSGADPGAAANGAVALISAETACPSDPDVITVSSADQLVDPGMGSFIIQFTTGASADALVLHSGYTDQVSGFDPTADVLDLRSLLNAAGVTRNWNLVALGDYVTVADQGPDAVVDFDPTGHGGGNTVAVLQGLGDSVTSLATLLADSALRVA